MIKSEQTYYVDKYLRIFGYKGMSAVDTVSWFMCAGMTNKQANKAMKKVLV